MAVSLAQVLARREERQTTQVSLLRETRCPVVSVTTVTPGPHKDDAIARQVCAAAAEAVDRLLTQRRWPTRARIGVQGPTGPEFIIAVDAPADDLKCTLTELEDSHPLGRLWDLDVLIGPDGNGLPVVLGRRELNRPPRRCLVCEADAAACARSARHPWHQVGAARAALATGAPPGLADQVADLAVQALLIEARLTPKPGLVDSVSNGAHDDMDLALFERSAQALRPWFATAWRTGYAAPGEVGPLVEVGIAADSGLMRVTGGVNTHRGALFGIGLLLGAQGAHTRALPGHSPTVDELCRTVSSLARPLLEQWLAAATPGDTRGPDAGYRMRRLTGARGEAASGFATVRHVGLAGYRQRREATGDVDDALRWALLALMATTADTNLVARGGEAGLDQVQRWARRIMAENPSPEHLVDHLTRAESWFVERRLSPGGSADLLSLTWLLEHLTIRP